MYYPNTVAPTRGIYAAPIAPSVCPVQLLPGLSGEIARELCSGGANPAIVGATLTACITLITQGTADLLWPNGVPIQIGAHTYLVESSGGGKSLLMKLLTEAIQTTLDELAGENPTLKRANFLIENATLEAIIGHLRDWPIAGLCTDEGGQVTGLQSRGAPTMAKLLDSAPLKVSRVSTGYIDLRMYRFCMFLAEQPNVFAAKKAVIGLRQGDVGLGNRFLYFAAEGQPSARSLHDVVMSSELKARYLERTRSLISSAVSHVQSGTKQLPALRLSVDAKKFLIDLSNELPGLRYGGQNGNPEYQRRHAERVLRLAGALHVFEHGPSGEVSLATLQVAESLARWCMHCFEYLTYEPPKPTKVEVNAMRLLQELNEAVLKTGLTCFLLREVRRYAPNMGMTKPAVDAAIAELAGRRLITVVPRGRVDWLQVLSPADRLFV